MGRQSEATIITKTATTTTTMSHFQFFRRKSRRAEGGRAWACAVIRFRDTGAGR